MECLSKNKDNLGLEILNLSLSSSTNSITSTSHTTVSRGPVSRSLSSIFFFISQPTTWPEVEQLQVQASEQDSSLASHSFLQELVAPHQQAEKYSVKLSQNPFLDLT